VTDSLNDTHRADLESWVESAQSADTDFPIQNLPYGVFRRRGGGGLGRVGVAIGDQILDLTAVLEAGLLEDASEAAAAKVRGPAPLGLAPLMDLGSADRGALRERLSRLLRLEGSLAGRARAAADRLLVPMTDAEMLLPAAIGDYTDFYASVHHATNVGSMFRPDNPLLPNYKHVPIGYHGRASSIVVSGTPVRRPLGQTRDDAEKPPAFGPSRRLDYEAEVGLFVGPGNALGEPIPIGRAEEHIFGLCLVNDWSARDVQTWEYQPLGPFLAKNFATTVSPWVVTLEALAPFRAPAYEREPGDPAPLPYLADARNAERGGFAIVLEVCLSSRRMRDGGAEPLRLRRAPFTGMYWTPAQMLTHHASNGCNLRPGDLLASGTVSGPTKESRGCLLELTWRGTEPLTLPTGETRRFLEDGDEVVMRGWCERHGHARIGFGECRGVVTEAR
jgi:fumarylacetoacetase